MEYVTRRVRLKITVTNEAGTHRGLSGTITRFETDPATGRRLFTVRLQDGLGEVTVTSDQIALID